MSKIQEDRSLAEVRDWKEQCRQEDEGLSSTEYLEKLRTIGINIKTRYHLKLQKVGPSLENHKLVNSHISTQN